MRRTWMHARRQLHELMLCGGAAEHQLALIPDAAEIADTYPDPFQMKCSLQTFSQRGKREKQQFAFANFAIYKKTKESTSQKQV